MGFTIQSACLHADWQVPLIKLLVGGKMDQTRISKIRSKLIEQNKLSGKSVFYNPR